MSDAERLLANPTDELRGAATELQGLSASSESESVQDIPQQDGSTLRLSSREGGDVQFEVVPAPDAPSPSSG